MDDLSTETSTESAGEFNLYEAADELIAESEVGAESSEGSQLEGQSETNPNEANGEKTLTSEEILEQMAKETDKGLEPEILSKLNSLGLVHKGLAIEIKDTNQLKSLIQQGFDYTQKTQAHAENVRVETEKFQKLEAEFKEKETRLVQKEQELEGVTQENKIIEDVLLDWKRDDPELFAHISNAYQAKVRQYEQSAPLIKKFQAQTESLKREIEGIKGQRQSEDLGKIRENFETELRETQEKNAAFLSKLGVKPDWNKVSEKWKSDISGTMTMAQALHATYGEEITKAYQSQIKNLQTKNKVSSNLLGRTSTGKGVGKVDGGSQVKNGDLGSFLRELSSNM